MAFAVAAAESLIFSPLPIFAAADAAACCRYATLCCHAAMPRHLRHDATPLMPLRNAASPKVAMPMICRHADFDVAMTCH